MADETLDKCLRLTTTNTGTIMTENPRSQVSILIEICNKLFLCMISTANSLIFPF